MRWKVGVKEVRELRGVMAQHGIARGQFVTTSDFSADAREFAAGNGIGLHDVDGLLAYRHTRAEAAGRAAGRRLRGRVVAADLRELWHQAGRTDRARRRPAVLGLRELFARLPHEDGDTTRESRREERTKR